MDKAPESYLSSRRPPLLDALKLESGTMEEGLKVLEQKGYFEPPPGPWQLGSLDRGMGRQNFAVLDCFGDVVIENVDQKTAELIILAVNEKRK